MLRMKGAGRVILTLGLLCVGAESVRSEFVVLRSGNGTIGGTDSLVNMLVGPMDSEFGSVFTPGDFASAKGGPDAHIIAPHSAWIPGLSGDSTAKWIATSATGASGGSTALYAIDFVLTSAFTTATLDLYYSVDNMLGGSVNPGVFFNGVAISGVSTGGSFTSEFLLSRSDIAPLLTVGTNTLYINATDLGGPAGLLFRAEITTSSSGVVPEPASITLVGVGAAALIGFGGYRAGKKRGRAS